jgi:hypothetical protein
MYRLRLHDKKSAEQETGMPSHLFFGRLILDLEDGSKTIFQNAGLHTD